jgi:hypothetical protein
MNIVTNVIIVLFLALIFLIIYYVVYLLFFSPYSGLNEGMIDIKPIQNANYSRSKCNFRIGETLQQVLDENNIKQTPSNGTLQFTCGYDEINNEIDKLSPEEDQRVFIIHNADDISAKDYLWNRLVISHGLEKAKTIMPNTYLLNNSVDRDRLKKEFSKNNIYIMKKNIQRQEGLKITNDLNEILDAPKSYVVVQEMLQDPYVINVSKNILTTDNRKTNMRFYVLVVCKDSNMDVYVFNDGFMYYTNEAFKKGSLESGPTITTGYIDRQIYENNPLTQSDFKQYLDKPGRSLNAAESSVKSQGLKISNVVFNRIYKLLQDVFMSSIGKACEGTKLKNNVSFQLFGVDVAVNDQLWPMVMEANKGPSLQIMSERDGQVKKKCVKDILKIVGALQNDSDNGFIQIINKEGDELGKVCL